MASRGGHQTTSDGTDYNSREKVATHYAASATAKSRLRLLVCLHYVVGLGHLIRLLPSLITALGLSLALPLPQTPEPAIQEYLWLLSLPMTMLALSACRRSNASQLFVFQWVLLACCLVPSILTLCSLAPQAWEALPLTQEELIDTKKASGTQEPDTKGNKESEESAVDASMAEFPLVWSAFLMLCLCLHMVQVIVIKAALTAWAPRHLKKH